MCPEDSEYIFLLVTALSLSFELLLLADKGSAVKTRTFLALIFEEFFVEPEICRIVGVLLEAERIRLARMNAEMKVIKVIQLMRTLLPDITTCTTAWDASMLRSLRTSDIAHYLERRLRICDPLESELHISRWSEEAANEFFREAVSFASLHPVTATASHVQVMVFSKPGSFWPFDCVASVDLDRDYAMMNTSKGVSMELEAGCSISAVTSVRNRMLVSMPEGSMNGFVGTIYILPGCSYRATKVEDVKEKTSDVTCTIIETLNATLEVSGGNYSIQRVNVGSRVNIENIGR